MIVYWLHDDTCVSPESDGYIGVTVDHIKRLYQHRSSRRFSKNIQMTILFEGDEEFCLQKEREFRPRQDMGWNKAIGGGGYYNGPKSEETRQKMSLAKKGTKRIKPRAPISEKTRKKMSLAKLGKSKSFDHRKRMSEGWANRRLFLNTQR